MVHMLYYFKPKKERRSSEVKTTTAPLLRIFLLGCIIPVIMSTIVYEGFSTNYTTEVFSERGFKNQYENGIYKYRLLGRVLLLKTYDYIKNHKLPTLAPIALKSLDQNGDFQFYSAYFYMNTLFLCLTCMVLFFILGGHNSNTNFTTVDLPLLFMCFLMAIAQYVVVPYDTLSYFFLSLAILLMFRGNPSVWISFALGVIVVLAALTRETAALILAFYFAHNYKNILTRPTPFKFNRQQKTLLLIVACFVFTYATLRAIFGYKQAIFQNVMFLVYFDIFSSAGIILVLSINLLIFFTKPVTREMLVFLIAGLPYMVPMLLIANPWEIRLWVPIILLLTIMKMKATQAEIFPSDQN